MKATKVMLVDDHEIVRLGLKQLFQHYDNIEVVAEAESIDEVLIKIEDKAPDVIVMDVRLKTESGIEMCREITDRYPEIKVIMLTSYSEDDLLLDAILAGAKGYVLKDVGNEQIIRAVRTVAKGESLLDPTITKRLLEYMRRSTRKNVDEIGQLTLQERKVLVLLAEGKTNKEIALKIFLSEKTVRNYVSSILGKLKLSNRTEAAAYAMRHELVK